MAANNSDLQRLWDDAWDAAPEAANTFRGQLRAFETDVGRLVSKGSVSSFSKNSLTTSFAATPGNLTQADIARAWRDLINLFDSCHTDLVNAGTAAPTDEQVYAEGKSYLIESPTECATDFSASGAHR